MRVRYADGYALKGEEVNDDLIKQACDIAKEVDTAIVCVGLPGVFEIEGLDRKHMRLPKSHDALVEAGR